MLYSSVKTLEPLATVFSMIGWMVACWTSIRITTWPPRSIMPKIGGLSFSRVPRPRLPLQSVAPALPSLGPHRLGIALVSGDNVELVELDVAAQDDVRRLRHDAVAQHLGLGIALA